MGSSASFRDTLVDLIRARHPVLVVETHEAERVIGAVQSIATDPTAPAPPGCPPHCVGARSIRVPCWPPWTPRRTGA